MVSQGGSIKSNSSSKALNPKVADENKERLKTKRSSLNFFKMAFCKCKDKADSTKDYQ